MSAASSSPPAGPSLAEQAAAMKPTALRPAASQRFVSPVLAASLLGVFVVAFRPLVAEPDSTLLRLLAGTSALQVVYAVGCLPPSGHDKTQRKHKPGERKRQEQNTLGVVLEASQQATLALLLSLFSAAAVHVVLVLFGAPLLTHVPATALLATHFAVLALFPLFYVHGLDASRWIAIAGVSAPIDEPFGGLVGAAIGAWLGATPIPLDWDREWQKWPVTVVAGLYGGYVLGRILGGSFLYGARLVSPKVGGEETKEKAA